MPGRHFSGELPKVPENLMRKRKIRSNNKATTSDADDHLLESRAATLGLDLSTAACCDRKTLKKLTRRCGKCGVRKACAADLKNDPFDRVWRTYCRNAEVFMTLAMAWWPRVYPATWGGAAKIREYELD